MQNNLQMVTRDRRSLFPLTKGRAQKDWQVFSPLQNTAFNHSLLWQHHWTPHLSLSLLPRPSAAWMCCSRSMTPLQFVLHVFPLKELQLPQANTKLIKHTWEYIWVWFALYRAKSYIQPTLSSGKISLSALEVSSFSKHLPSHDYSIQAPAQIPHLSETFSSVCYLFLHWENKNIDWWFALHVNLRKQLQLWKGAKEPDVSTGNNFQGLKYGFCHQSSGARKRKKFLFNCSLGLFFPGWVRLGAKRIWDSWERLRPHHFLIQNVKMLKASLVFSLSELQCRKVLLLSEKWNKRSDFKIRLLLP